MIPDIWRLIDALADELATLLKVADELASS
jgi:hypothetical protein